MYCNYTSRFICRLSMDHSVRGKWGWGGVGWKWVVVQVAFFQDRDIRGRAGPPSLNYMDMVIVQLFHRLSGPYVFII